LKAVRLAVLNFLLHLAGRSILFVVGPLALWEDERHRGPILLNLLLVEGIIERMIGKGFFLQFYR
jgi:hypothetical protein